MFNFNSIMHSTSQFQNPNPCNPNCDDHRLSYTTDQLNNSPYFRIANFLMSDEDDGSKENVLLKTKDISENIIDCSHGSSNSVPFARNIKCGRGLKKYKAQEEFRFAFRTKTNLDFMDDGYKWRKYGKKMIKNSPNPRNYFKCSSGGCNVKKRVERDSVDPSYVITTYQGMHNHESPTCVLHCCPQPSSLLSVSSSTI